MSEHTSRNVIVTVVVAALLLGAAVSVVAIVAGGDDTNPRAVTATSGSTSTTGATYAPAIDPADFGTEIDNPLLPLAPGMRWVYEGTSDEGDQERNVVEVLARTRDVMGVQTVVVHDVVSTNGSVTEDTFDWYAQDLAGNVWYFGEDSKEIENGKVASTAGSWEAGVDGAQPGIVMEADPKVGDRYRQEYLQGEAEDMAEILQLDAHTTVPFGSYKDVLLTKDWTPLEPDLVEHKFYALGVGVVAEETVSGGSDRAELVSFTHR